jgi:hypothetical protein
MVVASMLRVSSMTSALVMISTVGIVVILHTAPTASTTRLTTEAAATVTSPIEAASTPIAITGLWLWSTQVDITKGSAPGNETLQCLFSANCFR